MLAKRGVKAEPLGKAKRSLKQRPKVVLGAVVVLVVFVIVMLAVTIWLATKSCTVRLVGTTLETGECPTAGPGVIFSKNQYVPNLLDLGPGYPPLVGVDTRSNLVVPLKDICATALFQDNKCSYAAFGDCTQCNKSEPSMSDPASWVTCNKSECQGSFTMTAQQECKNVKALVTGMGDDTFGLDFMGMFGCLRGGGHGCTFDNDMKSCTPETCPQFTLVGDNNKGQYHVCDQSGTKTDSSSLQVAFAPFGHKLS